jgi:protein TonB
MGSSFGQQNSSRRIKGMLVVLLVHVLIGYALVTGTARQGLNLIKKPLEVVLIQEVTLPPPPQLPPRPERVKPPEIQAPKLPAPLPFVPQPDAPVMPAPEIATALQPPPKQTVIEPPPSAPPAPVPVPQASRTEMAIACPIQLPPAMPIRALRDGMQGVVRAQALIRDGAVKEVTILSGPPVFHQAVRAAMLQYQCTRTSVEVIAVQEFNFRIQ